MRKKEKNMSTVETIEPEQSQKSPYQKRRKFVWMGISLLLIGGYFLWWFFQRKAVGTIRVTDISTVESSDKMSEKRLYKGKFTTFSHGAIYEERAHLLPESGPLKESVFLSATDVEGRTIAVTVADRGTEDLSSDPAFQMRQMTTKEYHQKNFQEGVWRGVLFEKNTAPFESTGFFVKNGFIMSVSVTSPFRGDDIEDELHKIVRNLTFSFE